MHERPTAVAGPDFAELWTAEVSQNAYVRDVAYAEIDARPVAVAVTATTLAVWDLDSGERLTRPPNQDLDSEVAGADLARVAVTHIGGTPVAVTSDTRNRIEAWDLRSGGRIGQPLTESGNRVHSLAATRGIGAGLAFVARGAGATSTVYSVPVPDEAVEVWDLTARKLIRRLQHGGYTDSIALGAHEGRALAVGSATFSVSPLIDASDAESRVHLWDVETGDRVGKPFETDREGDLIGSVAVGSVEGRMVVVAESGGDLCAWDWGGGRPTERIHNRGSVAFVAWGGSAERPLVLASGGDLRAKGHSWLRVWDPQDWRLLGGIQPGYGVLSKFAAAPDGRVILPWAESVKVVRYVGEY